VRKPNTSYTSVIFDLGGVFIDWNPRHLYRQLFPGDEEGMERFLAEVTTPTWNRELDGGRSFAEAITELPEHADLIAAYWDRWPEMLGDVNVETVAIVRELRDRGVHVFALSDWSAETFPLAKGRITDLALFEDVQISGEAKITKADPRAFELATDRFGVDPSATVFVDDIAANVESAWAAGFTAIQFVSSEKLRAKLAELGVLDRRDVEPERAAD